MNNDNNTLMNELVILESLTNICIFRKYENIKKKGYKLIDYDKIKNKYNKFIKKKIYNLSIDIKQMSYNTINIDKLKKIQSDALNDIDNLNKIINIINYYIKNSSYLEIYEN